MKKLLPIEFVTMLTPYGDTFVIFDKFINSRGNVIDMWTTLSRGTCCKSPSELEKRGYVVLSRRVRYYPINGRDNNEE